ncbi:MAG: Holliday junction branch migration protein RuvA [Rhodothermales bacterium]
MIAYVSGTLAEKKPTEAIIDVQGLGYFVLIPTSTYEHLPATGEAAKLFTYQHVREDALQLFGFFTRAERTVFEIMLGVSGIGPKLALAALSAMRPAELRDKVVQGDIAFLTRIPGVGKKVAERMVVELRDKLAKVDGLGGAPTLGGTSTDKNDARADALAALESLGLSRAAAERNLRKVLRTSPDTQSVEDLIRLALRENG